MQFSSPPQCGDFAQQKQAFLTFVRRFTMNFKMKAAVAAIALTASMSANAAMSNSASGDSSLILTLLDSAAGVSATFDLDFSKSTFNQLADNSWNVSTGNYAGAWDSFWSTATAANTQYSVFAGDSLGGVATGDRSIFTTSAASTLATMSNTQLATSLGNFDTYITATNALGNHGTVASGASSSLASANADYAGVSNAYGTAGKIGNVGGDTNGAIGSSLSVFNIANNGTSGLTNATVIKVNGAAFNLSSTGGLTYSVAAVPEADTWTMMLVGLGLMGFIARRRTAA
jgi:hypothetical protein